MEKYQFLQRLGQGSFAVVWKARRKSDGRLTAVKQLKSSPESWDECKRLPEVRSAGAIQDRKFVTSLLEAVRHGGDLFLVFEYLETSLHACMALGQRIDETQVRWAARRLLAGLAAVHAAGLVHCDVKPENILVGFEGGAGGVPTMKLCDFGQAADVLRIGCYVGTRWYRAPELLLNARGDAAVDIWSAGCTVAELILRRPLFPGSDSRDMLFRMCGEIGSPESSWPLAAKMAEASGRANAEAAAWTSLAEAGASEGGVRLLAGLLCYDAAKRWRADKALREAFFAACFQETAIALPAARPMSPETLTRHRDEAAEAERRIRRAPSKPDASAPADASGPGPRSQVVRPGGYNASGGRGPGRSGQRQGEASPSPPPPRARPCEGGEGDGSPAEEPHQGGEGGDSDDEALAEMFWDACKAGGGGTPARSPEHGSSSDEEASQFVPGVADRGRTRRTRPT